MNTELQPPSAQGTYILNTQSHKPSAAFLGASWVALILGVGAYSIGLWNAAMQLNEKGYYFTVLMYGLFAAVSVQKNTRYSSTL